MRRIESFFLFLLLLACVPDSVAQTLKPGQSYPLPAGEYRPQEIAVCSSADSVLFRSKEGAQNAYYVFHLPTNTVKEIIRGGEGSISASPSEHLYAVVTEIGDHYELLFVDEQGTLSGLERHPVRLWDPQWASGGRELVMRTYDTSRPRPAGEGAFTAIALYGIYTQKLFTFPVDPPGVSLRVGAGTTGLYVFPSDDPKAGGAGARVYNLNGNITGQRLGMKGTMLSATGVYYLSPQTDPNSPWAVYDAPMHRVVREFNRPGKNVEPLTYLRWNPKNDRWLAVRRTAADGLYYLEVIDAESGKTLRTIAKWDPKADSLPWAWLPDGTAIVYFQNARFYVEPVKP